MLVTSLSPRSRDIDGNEVCSFIPNEEFGFHFKGRKVVMMLDEIGKARGGVMNACTASDE
jgi:hypothetical protein